MKPDMETRLAKLRHRLMECDVDTFLVLLEENRRYISGFTGEDGQFDESAGALFITQDKLKLATDSRYELQAGQEAPTYDIFCYKKGLIKEISQILDKLGTQKLGFESERMSVAQYNELKEELESQELTIELVDLKEVVESQRLVKDASEIEATRKALDVAERVFRKVVQQLEVGVTERAVAWAMEKGMRDEGAEALSFPTIVAFGANSALPHAVPGDRTLEPGQPVLFDWGARLDGYCSDTSRTVILGQPDDVFLKVHRTVLEAQNMAIEAIKAGVNSKDVDGIARNYIENAGYPEKFGHGLGHGTGLAIHELPRLSPIKEIRLEPGMLVTVEPGIYLPGWGGVRIENQVVVREDGAEVLNRLPRSYKIEDYV